MISKPLRKVKNGISRRKFICCALLISALCLSFSSCAFYPISLKSAHFLKEAERDFKMTFPDDITPVYVTGITYIDGGVTYFYYTVKSAPSADSLKSKTEYDIGRETFTEWITSLADGMGSNGKAISDEYKPCLTDSDKYFCYKIKAENRIVYLYVIYSPENLSVIVCRETVQYAHTV